MNIFGTPQYVSYSDFNAAINSIPSIGNLNNYYLKTQTDSLYDHVGSTIS